MPSACCERALPDCRAVPVLNCASTRLPEPEGGAECKAAAHCSQQQGGGRGREHSTVDSIQQVAAATQSRPADSLEHPGKGHVFLPSPAQLVREAHSGPGHGGKHEATQNSQSHVVAAAGVDSSMEPVKGCRLDATHCGAEWSYAGQQQKKPRKAG